MNDRFQGLLKNLNALLNSIHAPILKRLNKGITTEDASRVFGDLQFPEEVFQLYNWHNGMALEEKGKIGEFWLFSLGAILPAEMAMKIYKMKVGNDKYWDIDKFPLFESRGGEYFLIDIDKNRETYGMIFLYSVGAVDFEVIISMYDSLESLFETIIRCFQQGAYFYNHITKTLGFNPDLERAIVRKYNPRADYWKIV